MDLSLIVAESSCMVIALATGVSAYTRMSLAFKLLLVQVFLALILLIVTYAITIYQNRTHTNLNNQWVFNLYTLAEATLFFCAGFLSLRGKIGRSTFILMILPYYIIFILQGLVTGFSAFENYAYVAQSITISLLYFILLYFIFNTKSKNIAAVPEVWVSVGLVLYFACCIPYFSLFNFLNENYRSLSETLYFYINDVLAYLRYLFIAVAFWLIRRSSTPISLSAHEKQ
jgi:hypothetical protein